jgi:hypothetical protein
MRDDLTEEVLRASQTYGPDEQDHPSRKLVELMDVKRFARVHGRQRVLTPRELIAVDLINDNTAPFRVRRSSDEQTIILEKDPDSDSSGPILEDALTRLCESSNDQIWDKVTRWIESVPEMDDPTVFVPFMY